MATPLIESSFTTGEVSPALFGNVQLARMHSAAATLKNFYVGYQGGAYSRAGTAFVGFSKQTGSTYPPRLISFQFSINQGLALEFGNQYMRVVFDGAFVTESPFNISAASNSNPATITASAISFAISATSNNSAVSASYVQGDTITLAGGVFATAAVLTVSSTAIKSLAVNARGSEYAPNDLITLAGGSPTIAGHVAVATTRVKSLAIVSGGSGYTNGAQVATGTTGAGTKFQVNVTVAGGVVTAIGAFVTQGSYTANPANLASEPVAGLTYSGLPGAVATFSLVMEIGSIALSGSGAYLANAASFTQGATSGSGAGATFNTVIFAPLVLSVAVPGQYTTVPANSVAQGATSGSGAGATFNVVWQGPSSLVTGDWIFIQDMAGMTQLNGGSYVVSVAGSVLSLFDVYGRSIDSTAFGVYTGGGIASRIFTLETQYAEQDLKWIKFTQSADVMSLCCVNQDTGTEYPPLDLSRNSDTNWTFTPAVPAPTVLPPDSVTVTASAQPVSPTSDASYSYVVTAVGADGSESIASPTGSVANAVNIAATSGTITISWAGVAGVNEYNVYKATPSYSAISAAAPLPPVGALFGFAGSAYGNQLLDQNIIPDFTQVPPLHKNPFARGQAVSINPAAQGSGYTAATVAVNSITGSGASFLAVVVGGAVTAYIQKDAGQNYQPTDTVTVSGDGAGATATLVVGPATGTYPGVVAYFQQRRGYAYTLNQPDTYFLSQPGSFTNFDSRTPTIDSDAITGTPWSVQVNGIQFMIAVAGGLMVLTGLEAYFLTGSGGSAFAPQPLTPASQSAQPQGFNGCSPFVPPIRIYQDVLYVQALGATYRDFAFTISQNNYTGEDITQNSTQLFNGFQIKEHAWCEEPYRVLWAVRNDGVMLSLTWVKPEKVAGWARHDTNGLFESVCSVTEPPVNALYLAAQRNIGVHSAYTIERMNDRLWDTVEEAWCVDCGFTLPMDTPAASLSASSATGLGSLTGVTSLVGGVGYSAGTTAVVVDDNGSGPGAGAVPVLTIAGGVITGVAFTPAGAGYVNPQLVITDPAGSAGGSGASARVTLSNLATFTASAAVFSGGDVGRVIRMGGGVATVTTFTDSTHVIADISTPITAIQPDEAGDQVQTQAAGTWTVSTPITTVQGLRPLEGATVTGLADGVAITPQTVVNGQITLGTAASAITVGLGFRARLQSVYLDTGEPTTQTKRGLIAAASARIDSSGPFEFGENQPDGSTLSPIQVAPPWRNMQAAPITTKPAYNSLTTPLCTDDIRIPINTGFSKHKQVCVQQSLPYPLAVTAFAVEFLAGDKPSQEAPQKQGRGK